MIEEIKKLIDSYAAWLRDKTSLKEIKDWVEITTPYLDRHNDYIQIYIKKQNGDFLLTDDGYTIEDLILSGCNIDTPKRQALLKMTLNGFGVQYNDNKLEVKSSHQNFPLHKHNLVQSILAVNDLFNLASPTVMSLFYEDVVSWLDTNEIRYSPKVKFTGKSGFDHLFDFLIPKSRKYPERLIQTISKPSRDSIKNVAFSWIDTKEVRPENSRLIAILNDTDQIISSGVVDALTNYDVDPVVWSKRNEHLEYISQ